jgi:hypothetical protein
VEGHHALVLQHICVTNPQHELAGAMVCEVCSAADATGVLAVLIILIKPTGLQGDISLLVVGVGPNTAPPAGPTRAMQAVIEHLAVVNFAQSWARSSLCSQSPQANERTDDR